MSVFKTAMRIVWGHRTYLLIYLLLLSLMGVAVAAPSSDEASTTVKRNLPTAAVIDRDGSVISQGVCGYIADNSTLVEILDDTMALQDATAKDTASYIVIIPQGYGESFMESAATCSEVPKLQTVISYSGASGYLMDVKVTQYLKTAYEYARYGNADQAQAIAKTNDTVSHTANVEVAYTEAQPVLESFKAYGEFSVYPLFASITVCVSLLMLKLNDKPVKSRMFYSPLSGVGRSIMQFLACLMVGIICWAWIVVLGLLLFAGDSLATSPVQVGVMLLSLLAYSLVSVSIGFLIGQLGASESVSNVVANIGGMVMAFFSGVWIPLSMMPSGVLEVSKFLPCYWFANAFENAASLPSVTMDSVAPLMGNVGICLLFGVAIFAVSLVIGKVRES